MVSWKVLNLMLINRHKLMGTVISLNETRDYNLNFKSLFKMLLIVKVLKMGH